MASNRNQGSPKLLLVKYVPRRRSFLHYSSMQSLQLISTPISFLFLSQSFSKRAGWLIRYPRNLSSSCPWAISAPTLFCATLQHWLYHRGHLALDLSSYSTSSPPQDPAGHQICHLPPIWALRHYTDTMPYSPPQTGHLTRLPRVSISTTSPCATATTVASLPSEPGSVPLHISCVTSHCVSLPILPLQSAFHFVFIPSDIHCEFRIRNSWKLVFVSLSTRTDFFFPASEIKSSKEAARYAQAESK